MNILGVGHGSGVSKLSGVSLNRVSNPILNTVMADSVSFGATKKVPVQKDKEVVKAAADSLSTSTSGHRAIYGTEMFDKELMQVFAAGVAQYAQEHAAQNGRKNAIVMLGGDTRQATRDSLPVIEKVLLGSGVNVFKIEEPVATPVLAAMAENLDDKVDISILLTASHNPWEYGGFNLVTPDGAIAPADVTQKVASKVKGIADKGFYYQNTGKTKNESFDIRPYAYYKNLLDESGLIDFDNIKNSGLSIYYDALGGTGDYVVPKMLEQNGIKINQISNEGRKLEGPDPNASNLSLLAKQVVADDADLKIGLANDGDSDRFGVIDSDGRFLTPNEVIFLTAYHLHHNKGKEGPIVRSQVTTSMLDDYAQANNLPTMITPVGFKFLAEDIIAQREHGGDIIVAGEESGGLTVAGHIPEKDGVMAILLMADLMAQEKKPLGKILDDVKAGMDLHFDSFAIAKKFDSDVAKNAVMDKMEKVYADAINGVNDEFIPGFYIDAEKSKAHRDLMIDYKGNSDGVKLYFTNGSQITVRKSGTEPKIRVYVDSKGATDEEAKQNCSALKEQIDSILSV